MNTIRFPLRKSAILISAALTSVTLASHSFGVNAQERANNDDSLEEITIKAHPLHEQGLSQSVEVLRGAELADALDSNLGDTLAKQAGIRSASFGAAAGRPIIHGLGGARVKTTEDRIDTLDVSVTSTDHAVTVEPFIADQISVLKGASTLLYGSGAIGGVVDVETGRIPTEINERVISGRAEVRFDDNADTEIGVIRLDGNLGGEFAWHFDAFSKQADDYEIPGEAESAVLRALEEAEGEEHDEEEEAFGIVEGSRFDLSGLSLGGSWITELGHFGASISESEGVYGLVGGHEEEEGEEGAEGEEGGEEEGEEAPGFIDFDQTRFDISAGLKNPFSGVSEIDFRLGVNDYQHVEVEGNGEVGSRFDNEAWEARLHLKHEQIAGFEGVFGLQLGDRDFSAVGEEAFVPPAETKTTGLYWVGERNFDSFSLELGARFENSETEPTNDSGLPQRDFDTTSASIGAVIPSSEAMTWSALFDYAERAPSIEELYSGGPHLATQTFEIGDVGLNEESSTNLSFSWAYEVDAFDAHVTLYRNDFSDFIFQASTGEIEDGLPVFVYRQANAEFVGLDLELGVHLYELAGGDLDLRMTYDTVSADLDSGENLPRIPSDRLGFELIWHNDAWRAKLGFSDVGDQNDIAPFELRTEGYQDVSLKVEYNVALGGTNLTAFLQGRNLSDEEQRAHTSFVKDFVPAPGRRVEAGIRLVF